MKTIALTELNRYLVTEAMCSTRTWLLSLAKSSVPRRDLLKMLAAAEGLVERMGSGEVSEAARKLREPIEFGGVGGNPKFPGSIWPKHFTHHYEGPPQSRKQLRSYFRDDTYRTLVVRVHTILRAIECFDDPSMDPNGRFGPMMLPGFGSRRSLMQQIAQPYMFFDGGKTSTTAVREVTEIVNWIHVENAPGMLLPEKTLRALAKKAYAAGVRGAYIVTLKPDGHKMNRGRYYISQPSSDMRLRYWVMTASDEGHTSRHELVHYKGP